MNVLIFIKIWTSVLLMIIPTETLEPSFPGLRGLGKFRK